MEYLHFDDPVISKRELESRWVAGDAGLVDIILKSVDIDGICRLRPYLVRLDLKSPSYEPLPFDEQTLRVFLQMNYWPSCNVPIGCSPPLKSIKLELRHPQQRREGEGEQP